LIQLHNITKNYILGVNHVVEALRDITINIEAGEIIGLIGPSGSGKSTFLNILGCLDIPDKGEIYFNDINITKISDKDKAAFRNIHIGFVFQNFNLIPVLNVYENIEFPFLIADKGKYYGRDEKIRQIVDEVGLTPYIKHRSNQLSGGQMQRVAIARALVLEPLIVLADEPTANTDTKTSKAVLNVMKRINEISKTTFIIASHDPLVKDYTHKELVIKDGKIE
jgi:putative ABC transport system ATP-binding protein